MHALPPEPMTELATLPALATAAPAAARRALGRRFWQQLLDTTPALTALDAQALDALVTQRTLAAGEWVFTHRTAARSLVLLLEGTVSVGRSDGAAMAPECLLHGPAWLDAASAWVAGSAHTLDARAQGSAVRVAELPRVALQALLLLRPALAAGLLAVLGLEVQRLALHTHELMHKDAGGRLAAWLVRHLPAAQTLLRLGELKRDIAAQLGMSPETLSRQMRLLTRRGLIEVHGYQVRVLDCAGLRQLAQA